MQKEQTEYRPFLYKEDGYTEEQKKELLTIRRTLLNRYPKAVQKRIFCQLGYAKDKKKVKIRFIFLDNQVVPDCAVDVVLFALEVESEKAEKRGNDSFFRNIKNELENLAQIYLKR